MVKTKTEVEEFITSMSDVDFTMLCEFLNTRFFSKRETRKAYEERFVREIKRAEESIANGQFVTSEELHEFLEV